MESIWHGPPCTLTRAPPWSFSPPGPLGDRRGGRWQIMPLTQHYSYMTDKHSECAKCPVRHTSGADLFSCLAPPGSAPARFSWVSLPPETGGLAGDSGCEPGCVTGSWPLYASAMRPAFTYKLSSAVDTSSSTTVGRCPLSRH